MLFTQRQNQHVQKARLTTASLIVTTTLAVIAGSSTARAASPRTPAPPSCEVGTTGSPTWQIFPSPDQPTVWVDQNYSTTPVTLNTCVTFQGRVLDTETDTLLPGLATDHNLPSEPDTYVLYASDGTNVESFSYTAPGTPSGAIAPTVTYTATDQPGLDCFIVQSFETGIEHYVLTINGTYFGSEDLDPRIGNSGEFCMAPLPAGSYTAVATGDDGSIGLTTIVKGDLTASSCGTTFGSNPADTCIVVHNLTTANVTYDVKAVHQSDGSSFTDGPLTIAGGSFDWLEYPAFPAGSYFISSTGSDGSIANLIYTVSGPAPSPTPTPTPSPSPSPAPSPSPTPFGSTGTSPTPTATPSSVPSNGAGGASVGTVAPQTRTPKIGKHESLNQAKAALRKLGFKIGDTVGPKGYPKAKKGYHYVVAGFLLETVKHVEIHGKWHTIRHFMGLKAGQAVPRGDIIAVRLQLVKN